jgi:GNAT superfamily N-acetyltransferase
LENHLAFLAKHRGEVTRAERCVWIKSEQADFSYVIVRADDDIDAHADGFDRAHWLDALAREVPAGWRESERLSYMRLGQLRADAASTSLAIGRATDERGIDIFSKVQAASFVEDDAQREPARQWLRQRNLPNMEDEAQHFLIASAAEKPVAVTLLLLAGDTAGIYAVGTLPHFRGRGAATALLASAVQRAWAVGVETVTLQVHSGSAAERLYLSLGFEVVFYCRVLRRSGC